MVKTYLIIAVTGTIGACLIALLCSRTVLSISILNARLKIKLSLLGLGLGFDTQDNRPRLFLGRWSHGFEPITAPSAKKKTPRVKKPADKHTAKPRHRLPFSIITQIIKAGLLFVGRFLASVQYDEGRLEIEPVIANPAFAGMAYGWSRALAGAFPGLRQVFDVSPGYGTEGSRLSGRMTLSIKNRRVVILVWRLLCDLPIKEVIKYRFFRKR